MPRVAAGVSLMAGVILGCARRSSPMSSGPAPLADRARQLFSAWDSAGTPGCAAAVDGRSTRLRLAVGQSSVQLGVPITDTTRFEAASVSKQVTAAALLLLVTEGRVSLDEDIRRWLPELRLETPVTVRQLLGHTSGLRDVDALVLLRDGFGFASRVSQVELWYLLARQRGTSYAPGTQQTYSNTGYHAAARIIERLTGRSLADFTRDRFFVPLGMTRTGWRPAVDRVVAGRAIGHRAGDGGWETAAPVIAGSGPGGLVTTVDDLQRWNTALASGTIAGGRALVALMETPVTLPDGGTTLFGLGLMVRTFGAHREVGHDGGTDGFSSFTARYPDHGLSVAVLCNDEGANATALGRSLTELVGSIHAAPALDSVVTRPARPFPAALIAGLYVDTILGRILRIEARGDSIAVGSQVFAPVDSMTYIRPGTGIIEAFGVAAEPPIGVVTINSRGQRVRFLRSRVPGTGPAGFARYAGRYLSEELGVVYEVRASETGITVGIAPPAGRYPFGFINEVPLELPAVLPDWFATSVFTFRFVPDAAGEPTRLRVSHERARNIDFVRIAGP